jgi:hypothetical protein
MDESSPSLERLAELRNARAGEVEKFKLNLLKSMKVLHDAMKSLEKYDWDASKDPRFAEALKGLLLVAAPSLVPKNSEEIRKQRFDHASEGLN